MPSVVITGASTGIGADAALYLDRLGYQVFAGVRQSADGEALREHASARLTPILIDVTQPESIRRAVLAVQVAVGNAGLDGLVNNAGIAVMAPLEFIPIEDLRTQLEINTIGQLAVTQAFLPLLRLSKGQRRIVNISSLSGTIVFPMLGAYAMSKWALEAMTDTLRRELAPWGIAVISIQPGSVATPIWQKGRTSAQERISHFPPEAEALYGKSIARMSKIMQRAGDEGMPVELISQALHHALSAPKPKTRYFIVKQGWKMRLLVHLPDRLQDRLLRNALKL